MLAKDKSTPAISGLGLDGIGNLSSLLEQTDGLIEMDIDQIDEDPEQPRKEFDQASLKELAATIKERGVKTPISVRPHPTDPGRHMINHGARRYRASLIAGKTTIPAFVDADYHKADQVIENVQREALTPREIAEYIQQELNQGAKKGDIAKALGKSPAFISQHIVLLNLPDPIADAFYSGRCSDVTVVNEIVKMAKKSPDEVYKWMEDPEQELTRSSVQLLKDWLSSKDQDNQKHNSTENIGEKERSNSCAGNTEENKIEDGKIKKPVIFVIHNEKEAELILNKKPSDDGYAWIRYVDSSENMEVDLGEVRLTALIDKNG